MKVVEVPNNVDFGQQVVINYPNIQYVPILTNEFDHIEIDIRDDAGHNIPFEFGRSIVVLHFRKRN